MDAAFGSAPKGLKMSIESLKSLPSFLTCLYLDRQDASIKMKTIAPTLLALLMTSCCSMRIPEALMIAPVKNITKSPGKSIEFFRKEICLPHLPQDAHLYLSGAPDKNIPLIVDEEIRVNGHFHKGFETYRANPGDYPGKDPTPIYIGVAPIDITPDMERGNQVMTTSFHDTGSVYCNGAVYLRFVCEGKK